jgi:hypothetical protein
VPLEGISGSRGQGLAIRDRFWPPKQDVRGESRPITLPRVEGREEDGSETWRGVGKCS